MKAFSPNNKTKSKTALSVQEKGEKVRNAVKPKNYAKCVGNLQGKYGKVIFFLSTFAFID